MPSEKTEAQLYERARDAFGERCGTEIVPLLRQAISFRFKREVRGWRQCCLSGWTSVTRARFNAS